MAQKVAVAIIHGVGRTLPGYADRMTAALERRCRHECGDNVVFGSVYWSPVLQAAEEALWARVARGGPLRYGDLRRLVIDFLADAIAYQVTPHDRSVYDAVHGVFAATLNQLAQEAGPNAPLCIIAHSLGTIIASNYIYDLQVERHRPILPETVRAIQQPTPLETGETLSLFYTLGSPLALWSLRYGDFGRPIQLPDPRLSQHHPALGGEWVNFYDPDDVLAFPIKTLNDAYARAVTADRPVDVGDLATSWNPLSHLEYWADPDIIGPIATGIRRMWQTVNP